MTEFVTLQEPVHYVHVDEKICNGCVLCMKACPTKAIRVLKGRVAHIDDAKCIDCGECMRICPRSAISALMGANETEESVPKDLFTAVSASTALLAQFDEGVLPNDVLLGLKRMGFSYVHDQTYTNEMFNVAIELFVREHREKEDAVFPLISPICPVVVRLIAHRFPSLIRNIPPLLTPREIVARESKQRLVKRYGCREENIRVAHITPCPSKMICIKEPIFQERSYLNEAVAISRIFETLKKNIQNVDEDIVLHQAGGIGLGWGMSGGEIAGLDINCLAISGLQETIRYLKKVEMGLLSHIDYIEFRTCDVGCLGGPYTVADKYQARHNLRKLIRMFGEEKRVKADYVKKLYEKGWFHGAGPVLPRNSPLKRSSISDISAAIEKQNKMQQVLKGLPRKECGVCGSPDCSTFAEDVVEGKASLKDCVLLTCTTEENERLKKVN